MCNRQSQGSKPVRVQVGLNSDLYHSTQKQPISVIAVEFRGLYKQVAHLAMFLSEENNTSNTK